MIRAARRVVRALVWLRESLAVAASGEPQSSEPEPAVPTELWAEAFKASGLTEVEAQPKEHRVTGRSAGTVLTLRCIEGIDTIAITGLGFKPGEVELRAEDFDTSVMKTLGRREIKTGDPAFDRRLFVRGEPRLVHGLLDTGTRRLLLGLFRGTVAPVDASLEDIALENVSLTNGILEAALPPIVGRDRRISLLQAFLAAAHRLDRPADPAFRLASNAHMDSLTTVRLVNLDVLLQEYPGKPATLEALRLAVSDPAHEIRLRAATQLGEEGEPVLLDLASDRHGPVETQVSAIRALGDRLSLGSAREILNEALRMRRAETAETCLASLGHRGGPRVVDPLAKVLAVERGALAVAAARALGATAEPSAEESLLAALKRRDPGVSTAAAEALGQVGNASAIPSLRLLESASRDDALRRAAREAVAQIQSRLTGADPGQLSLAGGESGQLSLSDDEAGRVALLEDDDDDAPPGESGSGSQI